MVIKRKSPCEPQGKKSSSAMPSEWDDAAIREAVAAADADAATATAMATVFGVPKNLGKRYVGVRQRPSGRWVAEIKDTVQKIRVWLGTYDSAEAAARAYDEAACLLRGPNTRTNFWPRSPSDYPAPPALPPKISSLLLRLKAKNSPAKQSTSVAPTTSITIDFSATSTEYHPKKKLQQPQQLYINADLESIEEFKFADFLNDQNFFTATAAAAAASPCCSSGNDSYKSQFMEGICAEQEERSPRASEEENERCGSVDFQLVDDMERLPGLFLPYDIAEEIDVGSLETGEESCLFGAAVKRMKYERRISASLYALNGVSECLRLRRGGVGDHLRELSNSCTKKQNMFEMEEQVGVETGQKVKLESQHISSSSSSSSSISSLSNDAELSLWSSLDLSPICWFT